MFQTKVVQLGLLKDVTLPSDIQIENKTTV